MFRSVWWGVNDKIEYQTEVNTDMSLLVMIGDNMIFVCVKCD